MRIIIVQLLIQTIQDGKKGKKLRSDKKKAAKKALKARNRAYYDSLRDSGNNQKSRSARKAKKRKGIGDKGKHLIADCGNVGCLKCNPMERRSVKVLSGKELRKFLNDKFPIPKPRLEIRGGHKGKQ